MISEVIDFSKPTSEWQSLNPEINSCIQNFMNQNSVVLKTSGSTGPPKEIEFTHRQITASASLALSALPFKPISALLAIPVNRAGGLMLLYRSMLAALKLTVVTPVLNPLEDFGLKIPEIASFTPMQISGILNSSASAQSFSFLKSVWIGGATISSSLESQISQTNVLCFETFGMTETASHIALRKIGTPDFVLLNGFKISTDSNNRLLVQHDVICPETIVTNDAVTLTSETSFKWNGRLDFVINSGGVKIHPEIIENQLSLLIKNPLIVSSVKNEMSGELPVLVVQANEPIQIPEIKNLLPKYYSPKMIFYLHDFPLTSGNKTDRFQIKKIIAEKFERMEFVTL